MRKNKSSEKVEISQAQAIALFIKVEEQKKEIKALKLQLNSLAEIFSCSNQ